MFRQILMCLRKLMTEPFLRGEDIARGTSTIRKDYPPFVGRPEAITTKTTRKERDSKGFRFERDRVFLDDKNSVGPGAASSAHICG
jgi:hypothetical protein